MLKSEKRESQNYKRRYGPRRHKVLGINKWVRKNREIKKQNGSSDGEAKQAKSCAKLHSIFAY